MSSNPIVFVYSQQNCIRRRALSMKPRLVNGMRCFGDRNDDESDRLSTKMPKQKDVVLICFSLVGRPVD